VLGGPPSLKKGISPFPCSAAVQERTRGGPGRQVRKIGNLDRRNGATNLDLPGRVRKVTLSYRAQKIPGKGKRRRGALGGGIRQGTAGRVGINDYGVSDEGTGSWRRLTVAVLRGRKRLGSRLKRKTSKGAFGPMSTEGLVERGTKRGRGKENSVRTCAPLAPMTV